jgi:DNA-binding transcriptional regulator LsrR (DeoR family)
MFSAPILAPDVLDDRPPTASTAASYAAARLYYEEHLTQQAVAERLGVSRSTVSRLLQLARDQDIVRIEVRRPSHAAELGAQLAAALGLRRAVVVGALAPGAGLQALVAPTLTELERCRPAPGEVMAISWGRTVWEIAQAQRFPSLRGVRLVPAVGGMDETDVRFQPNEIARRVAGASGAEVSFLHVPALPSASLRASLLADPEIAARLALWERVETALVGIGMAPAGLTEGPSHVLAARDALRGAVGDIVSRHFDAAGAPVELPHEELLLAMSRAQLRAAGTVIAVSAGPGKAPAVVGAARARIVDVLVTDATTAASALELVRAT